MKTTLDVDDELFARAERRARESGLQLRALVEEGLRRVLSDDTEHRPYRLPDLSVGDPAARDPLESYSWQDLRELIYGDSRAHHLGPSRGGGPRR